MDIYVVLIFGIVGVIFVFIVGLLYLESRCKKVKVEGEGYFGFNDGNIEMVVFL